MLRAQTLPVGSGHETRLYQTSTYLCSLTDQTPYLSTSSSPPSLDLGFTRGEEVMLHVMGHKLHNLKHLQHINTQIQTDTHLQPPSSADSLFDQPQLFWILFTSLHMCCAVQLLCSSISRPCSPTHKRHHTKIIRPAVPWMAPQSVSASLPRGAVLSRPQSLPHEWLQVRMVASSLWHRMVALCKVCWYSCNII